MNRGQVWFHSSVGYHRYVHFQPQIIAVDKKKVKRNVLFWSSINWVLKALKAEPASFGSKRKLCPEYKGIRTHTASFHGRFQCSLWLASFKLALSRACICIPIAGAFDARVRDLTNGVLMRKLKFQYVSTR